MTYLNVWIHRNLTFQLFWVFVIIIESLSMGTWMCHRGFRLTITAVCVLRPRLLCSLSWPWTWTPPASASWVLGCQLCVTMPGPDFFVWRGITSLVKGEGHIWDLWFYHQIDHPREDLPWSRRFITFEVLATWPSRSVIPVNFLQLLWNSTSL
jgi:hypothetical protein